MTAASSAVPRATFTGRPEGDLPTDEVLVKEFQAGDREAFAELYRRYFDRVAGYVRNRRSRAPQSVCEELVQQVFTEAYGQLSSWQDSGNPDAFRRWLFGAVAYSVLLNEGRQHWRDRQAYFWSVDRFVRELRRDSDQVGASAAEISEALRVKLDALRPHYRQALELHYLEGLSIEQTAEVMGRTFGSVKGLVSAALNELRAPKNGVYNRADKTARILTAACQLLAEHGEAAVTMSSVAKAAGVSRGLPGHYFGSRADLLAQALRSTQPATQVMAAA